MTTTTNDLPTVLDENEPKDPCATCGSRCIGGYLYWNGSEYPCDSYGQHCKANEWRRNHGLEPRTHWRR